MSLVPWPTAVVRVQRVHLIFSTMLPESPLKKIPRGLIPEYGPAMSFGNDADAWAGTAVACDVSTAPPPARTMAIGMRWRRMLSSPLRYAERLVRTRRANA